MSKKTILILVGAGLYLALGIVVAVSLRAASLPALLDALATASIVVGAIALAAAVGALLISASKEGGGLRGGALIALVLGVPVYFALQERPAEMGVGHGIAVLILGGLQTAAIVAAALLADEKAPRSLRIGAGVALAPAGLLTSSFVVLLVRSSWALFRRGYPLVTRILVGVVNPVWTIALVCAPPILAAMLMQRDEGFGR